MIQMTQIFTCVRHRRQTNKDNQFVPEQLRALAFVAEEDLESGRNFISGCLDLRASRAEERHKTKMFSDTYLWMVDSSFSTPAHLLQRCGRVCQH